MHAAPAHRNLAHLSCLRSRCNGHTPSFQGCTVRCHIETHFQSRAVALETTITEIHISSVREQSEVQLFTRATQAQL